MISNINKSFWEDFVKYPNSYGIQGNKSSDIWNFIMGLIYGLDGLGLGIHWSKFKTVTKKLHPDWLSNVSIHYWLFDKYNGDDEKLKAVFMEILREFILSLNENEN